MTTKLTAADLVVGQTYLVQTLDGWGPSTFLGAENSLGVTWCLFSNSRVHGKCIERYVRPHEPPTFPDPPPGRKWRNPEGLTPEQVGVAEGWRLCLEDEMDDIEHEYWVAGRGEWVKGNHCGIVFGSMGRSTYRTKHPIDGTHAALRQRIAELEEEVRRNSWRPVSEKPEEGDADAEGYLPCIWGRPDGTAFTAFASLEAVRDAEATATPGCNRITHWRPANLPPITEDQKFARWKAAASEEDRDAAMRAGWKGGCRVSSDPGQYPVGEKLYLLEPLTPPLIATGRRDAETIRVLREVLTDILDAKPHEWYDPSDFVNWAKDSARYALQKTENP